MAAGRLGLLAAFNQSGGDKALSPTEASRLD
jgi:hypothetical protein